MNQNDIATRVVSVLLVAFLVGYGWIALLSDGISISGRRGSDTFLTGAWAAGLAAVSFLFAAISSLILSKAFSLHRGARLALVALILLPPALYSTLVLTVVQ